MEQRKADKPAPRRRIRSAWTIAALMLLCVLLMMTYYFVQHRPDNVSSPVAQTDDRVVLRTEHESIVSITVVPVAYPAFTLVRDGETFVVEGSPDYPLKQADIETLVAYISSIEPAQVVGELTQLQADIEQFGFSEDSPRVTAHLKDGRVISFRFGADAPTEVPAVYFLLDHDPHLYTINSSVRDLFDRGLHFLHLVPEIAVEDASAVRSISVTSNGKDVALTRQADDKWRITSPFQYPVDDRSMDLIMEGVLALRLAVFAEDITEHTDLEKYGLAPDSPEILIAMDGKPEISLRLGKDIRGVGIYCEFEGAIYMATYLSVGFLQNLSAETLAFKGITDIPFEDVRKLEVRFQGLEYSYDILWYERVAPNNELMHGEDGQVLMDLEVTTEGKIVDAHLLTGFFERISSLRSAVSVPQDTAQPLDAPWLTIIIHDSSQRQMLAFHRMDEGISLLSLDDVVVCAFEEAALWAAINQLIGA